jgi:HEPN domain-containing protein
VTWATGRDRVQSLLDLGHLELVAPSGEHAALLMSDAQRHLASAGTIASTDAPAAYALAYDAARKALSAVLAKQGLRATSSGGHVAVQDAIEAQLGAARSVVAQFGRMRRRRRDAEYPDEDSAPIDSAEVIEDVPHAEAIVEAARKLIDLVDGWE